MQPDIADFTVNDRLTWSVRPKMRMDGRNEALTPKIGTADSKKI
jgi:hypothetical protein